MYPVRTTRPKTARAQELGALAARRQVHWLSAVFGWAGCVAGCFAAFVLVAGLHHAATLSRVARPAVHDKGFSEAATATFGAMLFGGGFALLALVLVGIALVLSHNRLRTLALAVPALVTLVLLSSIHYWAP